MEGGFYRFGEYILDPSQHLLRKNGTEVPLTPKVFDTLLILVERRGETIRTEELIQAIWKDTFAAKNNLDQNLHLLRKALGDSFNGERYIKTIPKIGYKFTADVEFVNSESNGNKLNSSAEEKRNIFDTRNLWNAKRIGLFALVVLLVGGGSVYFTLFYRREPIRFDNIRFTKLTTDGQVKAAAISPDAKFAVYVRSNAGRQELWLRQIANAADTKLLDGGDGGVFNGITFSPEGDYVYFTQVNNSDRAVYRIPSIGGTPRKIIDNTNLPFSIRRDGEMIAFVRIERGTGTHSLMVANMDGTGERELAQRKQAETISAQPAWSPDGRHVAFVAGRPAQFAAVITIDVDTMAESVINAHTWDFVYKITWPERSGSIIIAGREKGLRSAVPQLWTLMVATGEVQRITNDVDHYSDVGIASDGKNIITVRGSQTSEIWVYDKDGTSGRMVTAREDRMRTGLAWLPDRRILFTSIGHRDSNFDIVGEDGTGRIKFAEEASLEGPTVARDGLKVAFASDRSGKKNIWIANLDGSDPRLLTNGDSDNLPSFSPDGRWLVYMSLNEQGDPRVWKIPASGGEPVKVIDQFSNFPTFSRDGSRIACLVRDNRGAKPKFAIIPSDGGPPEKVLEELPPTIGSMRIKWAPDDKAIAFIDTRDGISNIWTLSVATGRTSPLTKFTTGEIFYFDWSNDGARLAVVRHQSSTDLVLISAS